MKSSELLHQVLEIEKPWQVVDVAYDAQARQVDIRIAESPERGSWFSRPRPAAAETTKQVWRHVNLAQRRCFIHLHSTVRPPPAAAQWSGGKELPFTHALARQIVQLLAQGLKMQAICELLDLQLADLWKFKYALDSGQTGLAARAPTLPLSAAQRSSPGAGVPDAGDAIWEKLLGGSVHIDIRFLSLKLLLTKLRKHVSVIEDNDIRQLKVIEIHRYFSRYEHMLEYELKQLQLLRTHTQPQGRENDK